MTITLKNVPRTLHQALKRQARQNKRSLNQDLIRYLEEKAEAGQRQKAFADLMRYGNKVAHRGIRAQSGLDPVKIIRALREAR